MYQENTYLEYANNADILELNQNNKLIPDYHSLPVKL